MTISIHRGSYDSIPPIASPGIQFLKHFLPALDSLDPTTRPIAPFIHPDANIYVGSNPPNTGRQVIPLFEARRKHLSAFHHDMHNAWDISLEEVQEQNSTANSKRRTVMFEATSSTVFRNDPDQFAIKMKEFNILELEAKELDGATTTSQKEVPLQVVEMRTYLDARPVQDRAARLHMVSAYAEGNTAS